MKSAIGIMVVAIFLLVGYTASWAQVVFVDIPGPASPLQGQLERACQLYGLHLQRVTVSNESDGSAISGAIKTDEGLAIVIASRALNSLSLEGMVSLLKREDGKKLFVLVLGVTTETDSVALSQWSNGTVLGCAHPQSSSSEALYRVSNSKEIVRQLAGLDFPIKYDGLNYLVIDRNREVQTLAQLKNDDDQDGLPILVKVTHARAEIFFATQTEIYPTAESISKNYRHLEMAPLLQFLRYACGERCWHKVQRYANLTIDDPWLIEPYGYLSYNGLLAEMQRSNFHTTIAFIPWNFDRSDPDVVSIFRKHPDRFSVSIHGNDHDQYEFYKYETSGLEPWPARSLEIQEANIKQGLARMEEFTDLTGQPFDKVMVFPHGIAPAKTLRLLKEYNFYATVNDGNIPIGRDQPADPLFSLRPMTMQFENFPSLDRSPPDRLTKLDVAFNVFLDNPVLLYTHHDFFRDGVGAFNKYANMVNRIDPDIVWQGLGHIAQRLYFQKLRGDGDYDIKAFSSNLVLDNHRDRDLVYYVRKEESFSPPIRQLTVDGTAFPYDRSANEILVKIPMPAKASRHLIIEYENDLDLEAVDLSKNDSRVKRLRKLSDFRDMTLSNSPIGRAVVDFYYETDLYKVGPTRLVLSFLLVVGMIYLGWRLRKKVQVKWLSFQRTK